MNREQRRSVTAHRFCLATPRCGQAIDPVWLARHPGFHLIFSNGVANQPAGAVPEPASWALMIIGFGLTGARARRHRATSALPETVGV